MTQGFCPDNTPRLAARAARISRVTEYLYWTGRIDWGHRWASEWHKLALTLQARGIDIYR